MTQLSRYTLLEKIGNSVLGAVYKAKDTSSGSLVTLRVLQLGLLDDVSSREMDGHLQRSYEAAQRLRHPGIARVLEMGRDGRSAVIASELVDGPTITSFVRASAGSDLAQVVTAVVQLLEALDFAHHESVIHRDLKPANVRVQGAGIKITDFGMAGLGAGVRDDSGTLSDRAEYMAPEQLQNGPVDRRCDIHAAGTILYELLTGKSPFAGDPRELSATPKVREFVPPPPSRVRPGLSPAFDRLVARALAKSPGERFATAQQFRNELSAAYEALTRRPPPDTLVRGSFAPPATTSVQSRPDAPSPAPPPVAERPEVRKPEVASRNPAEKVAPPIVVPPAAAPPTVAPPAAKAAEASRAGSTSPGPRKESAAAAAGGRAGEAEKPTPSRAVPEPPKVPVAEPVTASRQSVRRPAPPAVRPAEEPAVPSERKGSSPSSAASTPAVPKGAAAAAATEPLLAAASRPEESRTKEPERKAEAAPGGTLLAVPKVAPPAPASSAPKERSAPEMPRAREPGKEKSLPGGPTPEVPKAAPAAGVSSDLHELVRQAVAVEVIQPQPAPAREAAPDLPAAGGTMLLTPKVAAGASASAGDSARPQASAPAPAPPSAPAKESVTVWAPAPEESGLFATHRRPAAAQNGPAAPPPAAPPEVSVDTPPGQSSLATPVPRLRPAKQIIPLTDASIAHAGRVLAQFLGPIALVLSRRAAQDAHDERSYLELLAAHLPDPDERSQFLREVRQRRS